jgi:hypothetical protein
MHWWSPRLGTSPLIKTIRVSQPCHAGTPSVRRQKTAPMGICALQDVSERSWRNDPKCFTVYTSVKRPMWGYTEG